MNDERRRFVGQIVSIGAGAALAPLLGACSRGNLPEGLVEVKWDRDPCTRCGMVLSDRRFAVQVKGGPQERNFKFDDIGCALFWLKDQAWGGDAQTRVWVTDLASRGDDVKWLDAKKAVYIGGKASPMGYNFGAVAMAQAGSVDFQTMREHVLAKGR